MALELGKLGLSDPEIEKETDEIEARAKARDPQADFAYFYLQTPQEIHRLYALQAMRMVNCLYCYNDLMSWGRYETEYNYPRPMYSASPDRDPKYIGTDEQRAARALSREETRVIYDAQVARMKKATIVHNIHVDDDGFHYNGIRW